MDYDDAPPRLHAAGGTTRPATYWKPGSKPNPVLSAYGIEGNITRHNDRRGSPIPIFVIGPPITARRKSPPMQLPRMTEDKCSITRHMWRIKQLFRYK